MVSESGGGIVTTHSHHHHPLLPSSVRFCAAACRTCHSRGLVVTVVSEARDIDVKLPGLKLWPCR